MGSVIKSLLVDGDVSLELPMKQMQSVLSESVGDQHVTSLASVPSDMHLGIASEKQGYLPDDASRHAEDDIEKQVEQEVQLRLQEQWEQAKQEGYSEGVKLGKAEANARLSEVIQDFTDIAKSARQHLSHVLTQLNPVVASIVFEVVAKMVTHKMTDTNGIIDMVNSVVAECPVDEIAIVKVSPKHYQMLLEHFGTNDSIALRQMMNLNVMPDPDIELGGCIVELVDGRLDATIETQMALFAKSLKAQIN